MDRRSCLPAGATAILSYRPGTARRQRHPADRVVNTSTRPVGPQSSFFQISSRSPPCHPTGRLSQAGLVVPACGVLIQNDKTKKLLFDQRSLRRPVSLVYFGK